MSYEKGTPTSLLSAGGLESTWKKTFSDARFILAALSSLFEDLSTSGLEPTFASAETVGERSVPPTLFLLHCAFLI